ncbi:MAG: pantetheine-phosphate adenylyltransferase [Suipraeoptans sp.]
MQKAIYPGSFDPVTFGHIDIIERAAKRVDELIVGILNNNAKIPLFSADERVRMLKEVTKDMPNVRVMTFQGLLVDFAKKENAEIIIRGLRAITDFEHELQMTQANHKMYSKMDTVFFATSVEYSYLSSTTVKEIAAFGGDIAQFVPPFVSDAIREKNKHKGECRNNE